MKYLLSLLVFISLIVLTPSCKGGSDSEIESKIIGTWEAEESLTETESGMTIKMKLKQTVTYNADKTLLSEFSISITSPSFIAGHVCSGSYTGTWSANKSEITETIDENSIDFSYLDSDFGTKSEWKQLLLEEGPTSVCPIKNLTDNELIVIEDEEEAPTHYYRK